VPAAMPPAAVEAGFASPPRSGSVAGVRLDASVTLPPWGSADRRRSREAGIDPGHYGDRAS
jgi:hypothetical protein